MSDLINVLALITRECVLPLITLSDDVYARLAPVIGSASRFASNENVFAIERTASGTPTEAVVITFPLIPAITKSSDKYAHLALIKSACARFAREQGFLGEVVHSAEYVATRGALKGAPVVQVRCYRNAKSAQASVWASSVTPATGATPATAGFKCLL